MPHSNEQTARLQVTVSHSYVSSLRRACLRWREHHWVHTTLLDHWSTHFHQGYLWKACHTSHSLDEEVFKTLQTSPSKAFLPLCTPHVFSKFVLLILNKTSQQVLFVQRSGETTQTFSSLLLAPTMHTSKQSTWHQPSSYSFAQLYILVGIQTHTEGSPKQLFLWYFQKKTPQHYLQHKAKSTCNPKNNIPTHFLNFSKFFQG